MVNTVLTFVILFAAFDVVNAVLEYVEDSRRAKRRFELLEARKHQHQA